MLGLRRNRRQCWRSSSSNMGLSITSRSLRPLPHRGRCQFLFLEKFGLVFANMPRAQAVWRKVEPSREIFDGANVTVYGSLCVITTLEFFQHHFAKMGHRNTSCDPHLHQAIEQPMRPTSREASAARAA